jgi:hypothetical protein
MRPFELLYQPSIAARGGSEGLQGERDYFFDFNTLLYRLFWLFVVLMKQIFNQSAEG